MNGVEWILILGFSLFVRNNIEQGLVSDSMLDESLSLYLQALKGLINSAIMCLGRSVLFPTARRILLRWRRLIFSTHCEATTANAAAMSASSPESCCDSTSGLKYLTSYKTRYRSYPGRKCFVVENVFAKPQCCFEHR